LRTRRFALLAMAGLTAGAIAAGARDPDSPEVQAAAKVALARARILDVGGRTLDVGSRILDLRGVSSGIEGLLKDLDAKVVGREIRIELSADVLFDFDSFRLRPEASETLRKVASVLKEYGASPVRVEGHTDGKGPDPYNQTLSERRADSVKRWLVDPGGVAASRISTAGFGKSRPVAPNTKPDGADDPEGRRKNRRVEITVKREG